MSFENGFFVTDCPGGQRMVEAHCEFGRHIFPLALDLTSIREGEGEDE